MADQASCRWWSTLKGALVRTRVERVVEIVRVRRFGLSGGKLMAVCVATNATTAYQRHQFSRTRRAEPDMDTDMARSQLGLEKPVRRHPGLAHAN